jgi:uncharacterized protein YbjT (DUF2867 family)
MTAKHRDAVVAGATGLVGGELLRLLATAPEYARVFAPTRGPLALDTPRIIALPAQFDRLGEVLGAVGAGCDVFCCLGSTIRAAGSREAFRAVDHAMVLALARWARRACARRFLLVSAVGADPDSPVFYNRTKGEAERDVRAEGPASVVVLRPSLLDGNRGESRLGERLALALSRPLARWIPRAYRPVAASAVAAAMLAAARDPAPPAMITSAAMAGAPTR